MQKIEEKNYYTITEAAEYLHMKYVIFYQCIDMNFDPLVLGKTRFLLEEEVEMYKEIRAWRKEIDKRRSERLMRLLDGKN